MALDHHSQNLSSEVSVFLWCQSRVGEVKRAKNNAKKKEVISRCQVAGMAKKFDQIQKREKQKTERQETQWQKANF